MKLCMGKRAIQHTYRGGTEESDCDRTYSCKEKNGPAASITLVSVGSLESRRPDKLCSRLSRAIRKD
jgi:hypothetical protein